MTQHLTTPKIEEYAFQIGIKRNTVYQWRRRGVSQKMRIKLVKESDGYIKLSDFPDPYVAANHG